jgi:hypothetical protein
VTLLPEVRDAIKDDLAKLAGRPPYNNPANLCWNDNYFARSLTNKYGASIDELERMVAAVVKHRRLNQQQKKLKMLIERATFLMERHEDAVTALGTARLHLDRLLKYATGENDDGQRHTLNPEQLERLRSSEQVVRDFDW